MEDLKFQIQKKYETITKTIRLPETLGKQLEELAVQNHISFNALVIQCIQFSLTYLE
ncbi:MAG: toxin-antitoxin system HicB family antitoxin [Oscillospiraceae bacterium]|nr:toxin-antitoxin system HicB family antitoxin [Oscillospiraceae bacterium]MDE5884547.1 toxin-antitoxin system HicB family antitoxin [Oscillospiraceae bacterium]